MGPLGQALLWPRSGPQQRLDQWTHTTAPSGSTCPGTLPSRLGAAITTTSVVSRQSHRAQPIHTTVRMDSRTGRQDGLWPRRSGAAGFTERAAQIRAAAV